MTKKGLLIQCPDCGTKHGHLPEKVAGVYSTWIGHRFSLEGLKGQLCLNCRKKLDAICREAIKKSRSYKIEGELAVRAFPACCIVPWWSNWDFEHFYKTVRFNGQEQARKHLLSYYAAIPGDDPILIYRGSGKCNGGISAKKKAIWATVRYVIFPDGEILDRKMLSYKQFGYLSSIMVD